MIVTILDTNVVSELMASSPSPTVLGWIVNRQRADRLFITTITVAEILYGVELLSPGKRRSSLAAEAEAMFKEDFAGRILPFDIDSARAFSQIAARRRSEGKPVAEFDAQIAAIASVHDAVVATRNVADFEGSAIRVINPWLD